MATLNISLVSTEPRMSNVQMACCFKHVWSSVGQLSPWAPCWYRPGGFCILVTKSTSSPFNCSDSTHFLFWIMIIGFRRRAPGLVPLRPQAYMGGCQNYGPLLGPLNTRCRIVVGTQKGTIVLTTSQMCIFEGLAMSPEMFAPFVRGLLRP